MKSSDFKTLLCSVMGDCYFEYCKTKPKGLAFNTAGRLEKGDLRVTDVLRIQM